MSDHAKDGLHKSTVGGRPPETLSAGIKRTAGSHPKERLFGGLPRALAPNRLRNPTFGGRPPETLSAGIKRTGGSHPKERVSGGRPRTLARARNSQCPNVLGQKPSARDSALSALLQVNRLAGIFSDSRQTAVRCFHSRIEHPDNFAGLDVHLGDRAFPDTGHQAVLPIIAYLYI